MSHLIITIDGPGGTGKSTVSRAVADRLGIPYLDTGAFYRAATLAAIAAGVASDDTTVLKEVVAKAEFDQVEGRMYLDGEDVSERIRAQDVEAQVSRVAANPEVRRILVAHQRSWAERHEHRAVIEGRDIGSVVFPDAGIKIYLDARPEVPRRPPGRSVGRRAGVGPRRPGAKRQDRLFPRGISTDGSARRRHRRHLGPVLR